MASELKVDKFTGVTTAGSILVTGEGNSTTTNLQQGLAKQWSQSNASTVLVDSFNTTSLTDNGTGDTTTILTNIMGNALYSVVVSTGNTAANPSNYGASSAPVDTSSHRSKSWNSADGSLFDTGFKSKAVLGDLA